MLRGNGSHPGCRISGFGPFRGSPAQEGSRHADGELFASETALASKRVLVIEDEPLVSLLIKDELRDAGATVLGPVSSVDDAMRLMDVLAADGGIDAAVLDINLQGQTVTPVADRLTALGVPFVFVTGYSDGRDMGRHRAAPALRKPFGPRSLVDAVRSLASMQAQALSA